jgi:hypothetical protein
MLGKERRVAGHRSGVVMGTRISPTDCRVAQLRRPATMSKVALEGFRRGVDLCYGKQGRRQHGFLARTVTVMGWTRGLSLFIGERGGNMGNGAACTWAHNGLHHAHVHAAEVQGRPASVKSMWCCAACHMRLSRREPGKESQSWPHCSGAHARWHGAWAPTWR